MKQICLIGPIDKRAVAYPLIKVADIVGKLLVITDDANFRRFADNYEKEFNRANSDFLIVNDIDEEIVNGKRYKTANYDFVVYITTNTLIQGSDKVVYCHGMSKTVLPEETLRVLEDIEHLDVLISQGKVTDKDVISVGVDKTTMGYVWACEEAKSFVPLKDTTLGKVSSYLFSDYIGVSKEEFGKLLMREEG